MPPVRVSCSFLVMSDPVSTFRVCVCVCVCARARACQMCQGNPSEARARACVCPRASDLGVGGGVYLLQPAEAEDGGQKVKWSKWSNVVKQIVTSNTAKLIVKTKRSNRDRTVSAQTEAQNVDRPKNGQKW